MPALTDVLIYVLCVGLVVAIALVSYRAGRETERYDEAAARRRERALAQLTIDLATHNALSLDEARTAVQSAYETIERTR